MPEFVVIPILVVGVIVILALAFSARYKTVSPDEAMIVTGAALGSKNVLTDHSGRKIKIVRGGAHPLVRTKGDANNVADPWTARLHGRVVWRVRGVVPKLGWAVFWFRSPLMHSLTVLLAPLTGKATIAEGTRKHVYKDVTLTIPGDAKVRDNRQPAQLSSLKSGQIVSVVQGPKHTYVRAHDLKSA